jgi:ppGpp synthetase/RelA/SpoT-type nucleotidyltranferase
VRGLVVDFERQRQESQAPAGERSARTGRHPDRSSPASLSGVERAINEMGMALTSLHRFPTDTRISRAPQPITAQPSARGVAPSDGVGGSSTTRIRRARRSPAGGPQVIRRRLLDDEQAWLTATPIEPRPLGFVQLDVGLREFRTEPSKQVLASLKRRIVAFRARNAGPALGKLAAPLQALEQEVDREMAPSAGGRERLAMQQLEGIAELGGAEVSQSTSDFDEVMRSGEAAQAELGAIAQGIAAKVGAEARVPKAKLREKAALKLVGREDGSKDASHIFDIARVSVVCTSFEQLVLSYATLAESTTIVKVKNKFAKPNENGYRDMNLLVQVPQAKHVGEVQLHLEKMEKVKSGPEHMLYDKIAKIQARAKADGNRALTADEAKIIALFNMTSAEVYGKALSNYTKKFDAPQEADPRAGVDRAGEQAAYDRLMKIPDVRPSGPVQKTGTTFDEFYEAGVAAQDELAGIARAIAAKVNGVARIPPAKTKPRATEKLIQSGGRHENIADIARVTIVCESFAQLLTTYETLDRETGLVQVKNKFANPNSNGYRDMNLLVRLLKADHVGEVQLHLGRIEEAKSGAEHKLYEHISAIKTDQVKTGRKTYTEDESDFVGLAQKMGAAIYEDAFDFYYAVLKGKR